MTIGTLKHALHQYRAVYDGLLDARNQIDTALDRVAGLIESTKTEIAAAEIELERQLEIKQHTFTMGDN